MPILSLCTGVGMLDVAVEHITGEKTAFVAEKDPAAAAVLAMRFPHASNLGDITEVDWAVWSAMHPEIDIIAAGFPCQDISNAGGREGISGKRSGLWKYVARAAWHIRPDLMFLENVGAIRTRGLDVVTADLARIGYDLRWTTLQADVVGAAHIRRRWFGLATPADSGSPGLEVRGIEPSRSQLQAAERGGAAAEDADGEPRYERVLAAPRQAAGGRSWAHAR